MTPVIQKLIADAQAQSHTIEDTSSIGLITIIMPEDRLSAKRTLYINLDEKGRFINASIDRSGVIRQELKTIKAVRKQIGLDTSK